MEFRTNSVQMSEEALDHQSNLCGEVAEDSSTGHDCPWSSDLNIVGELQLVTLPAFVNV